MEAVQGVCSAGGASAAGLVTGSILTFCLVAGFTFLFALLTSRIRDRKKQLRFVGGLIVLIFVVNIAGVIVPGFFEVLPVHLPAMALLLLVPLAIVLAGLLWSWPENHTGITIDAVLCSLMVTIAGFVLLALLSISGLMARLVHPATNPPGQAAVLPGGSTMLVTALVVFVVTLVLAAGGYKLLALFRNRKGLRSP
jgi:4-amino-4-deoxy-L-arabinose transferase-like glycosyltransferase